MDGSWWNEGNVHMADKSGNGEVMRNEFPLSVESGKWSLQAPSSSIYSISAVL